MQNNHSQIYCKPDIPLYVWFYFASFDDELRLRAQSGANYKSRRGTYGTFTRFTRFTIHLEHMEQPLDMFYSIAFERFESGSSWIRPSNKYRIKGNISLTGFLIRLEPGSNPARNRLEPGSKPARNRLEPGSNPTRNRLETGFESIPQSSDTFTSVRRIHIQNLKAYGRYIIIGRNS